MDEPYQKLDPDEFLLYYDEIRVTPPSKANYDELPYNDLSPRRFEQLCLKYNYAKFGITNCTLYGNPGQEQHGLDILVFTDTSRYILYQCKRVQEFTAANLITAIQKFVDGDWFGQTKQFVLFSSNELNEKNFVNEFEVQRVKLISSGITLIKMGSGEIDVALREEPAIVDEFFGEEWVKKFVGAPFRDGYLKELKPLPPKKEYKEVDNYISRKLLNPQKTKVFYTVTSYDKQTILEWLSEQNANGLPVRTVIRSDAGLGKSKELEHLAHVYSHSDKRLFPVVIRLKNYDNDLNKLISAFYEDWQKIPGEYLLFLFDGLDEVPNTCQKKFIKEFNLHLQVYSRSNIIATARSNHSLGYIGEGIDPDCILREQFLQALTIWDVHDYIKDRLQSTTKITQFNTMIRERKLEDLLSNPFYLKNLCDIFDSEKITFPVDRADAIRKIISLKFDRDQKKYESGILDEATYLFFAKKLAIYLTLTGTNSIPFPEISKFSDIKFDDLKYCSLFSVEENDSYFNVFFEHNNFQEYLAAHYLSELTWADLSKILFHEPGLDILKPRLINTANYLFTLLKTSSESYLNFLDKLTKFNNDLLLIFERDKIPFSSRLEIFKAIILKGKAEEIYYLRSTYRVTDLLEFINHAPQGLEFVIDELNAPLIGIAHQQCLLEIALFFKSANLTGSLRQRTYQLLKRLIREDLKESVHDLTIDVMTMHNFLTAADINFIIRNCRNLKKQMVMGALFKMIRKAQSESHFKFILEHVHILLDDQRTVIAGLKYEFFGMILELLDQSNIRLWTTFIANKVAMLSDMLDNIYDPDKGTIINEIYIKMAAIYTITVDNHIYDEFFRFLNGMEFYHSETHWGNPSLFFLHSRCQEIAFKQLLEDGANLMFRLMVAAELANKDLLKRVFADFKNGKITQERVNNVKFMLNQKNKIELEAYFNELFANDQIVKNGTTEFNWNKVQQGWQIMDFELLRDKDLFLMEAGKLYAYISSLKDFDENDDWFALQFDEKAAVKKLVNNSLIFRTLERNKITGGFSVFKEWFSSVDWDWFVFFNLKTLLVDKKVEIPADLLQQFKTYVLQTLLPKVNFKMPFVPVPDRGLTSVPHAATIRSLFTAGHLELPQSTLVDMLSFDTGGYYKIVPGNKPDDRLYNKIYDKIGDDNLYKQRVLLNLQKDFPAESVLRSHCSACVSYYYTEAIPLLLIFLNKKGLSDETKTTLVKTILSLGADPTIFTEILLSIPYIKTEWQWGIFDAFCAKTEDSDVDLKPKLLTIADKSVKKFKLDHRLKWDMIKAALKLGSTTATNELFAFLKRKVTWHNYSSINAKDFARNSLNTPGIIIDKCFKAMDYAINLNMENVTDVEKFLKKIILQLSVVDYTLMVYALQKYEDLISKKRKNHPLIVYLRWDRKEIVKEFYLQTSKFETENQVIELLNMISV